MNDEKTAEKDIALTKQQVEKIDIVGTEISPEQMEDYMNELQEFGGETPDGLITDLEQAAINSMNRHDE